MYNFSGIKTPFYFYNLELLERTVAFAACQAARHGYVIHYAIKANSNPAITQCMAKHGFGVDCVSGNEVKVALTRGFSPKGIVYAGVGKSDEELEMALRNDIFCLNCESVEELGIVAGIAQRLGVVARVALRVKPEVDAHTHRNITTGKQENKFGISLEHLQSALDICQSDPNLKFMGLHFHIGSQIMQQEPYVELCHRVNQIWREYRIEDLGGVVLNLGGGLGIDYADPEGNAMPDFEAFFNIFSTNLDVPEHVEVHFELGRSLVGQCGSLITKVLYTKQGVDKKFVVTDAGMTELMRPALYQAVHRIENLAPSSEYEVCDVVGPVCESTDVFAKGITLSKTSRGDLLAIRSCGAYTESMTLNYNLRDKAGVVLSTDLIGKAHSCGCCCGDS